MKNIAAILFCAGVLSGCGPHAYVNKSYQIPTNPIYLAMFGKDAVIHLGDCKVKTKDNEGCGWDASLSGDKFKIGCRGSWWVKKQYGEQQIVIEWSSLRSECGNLLGESSSFTASDFKYAHELDSKPAKPIK